MKREILSATLKPIKKAKRVAEWILRTFQTRGDESLKPLWKSLLEPILDYCSQLWSSHKTADIQALELVHHSFTRQISGLWGMDYWTRLWSLSMYSQQRMRERYIIIYVWKILQEIMPNPSIGAGIVPFYADYTGCQCVKWTLQPGT